MRHRRLKGLYQADNIQLKMLLIIHHQGKRCFTKNIHAYSKSRSLYRHGLTPGETGQIGQVTTG